MKKQTDKLVRATLDRFENGFAIIDFGRLGQLSVPKRYLPEGVKEGDSLVSEFITDTMATERRRHLARAVLKEILNTDQRD